MSIQKKVRPSVVIVAGVLVLVFGGFNAIGGFCGLLSPLFSELQKNAGGQQGGPNQPPDIQAILAKEVPSYVAAEVSFSILALFLGAAAIWVGISLLNMTPSARVQGVVIALVTLLVSLSHYGYTAIFILEPTNRIMDDQAKMQAKMMGPQAVNQGMEQLLGGIMKGAVWAVLAIQLVFTLVSWLAVFFLLTCKTSRDAFSGKTEPEPILEPEKSSPSPYAGYDDDEGLPPLPPPETGITDKG